LKNKYIFIQAPAFLLCWCLFCLQACKNPLVVNSKLLTKSDNLNLAKDTLPIKVITQAEPRLASNGVLIGGLGSFYDRNFGTTYASFYAQCEITTNALSFGSFPSLDSVVLTVAYNGNYGNCTKPINLAVYELNQDMYSTSTYYTNSSFAVKTPPIGALNNFVPDFIDSLVLSTATVAPELDIPLSRAFGIKLLTTDSANLSTDSLFLTYFKGIFLTSTSASTGNGLMYLNYTSPASGINLYYHYYPCDTCFSQSTPSEYTFPFSGIIVNHFDNTYNSTPVNTAIQAGSNAVQSKVYIQGGAGTRAKITMNLDSLPKKIGVNKAELVLSQTATDTLFPAPLQLALYRADDAGQEQVLDDNGTSGYGGIVELDSVNGIVITRYRFNITRYFQKLVEGIYNNNGLFIETSSPNTASERIVIANPANDKNYRITLDVTFTKL